MLASPSKIGRWEYNGSGTHRALGERTLNEIANEFAASCELIGKQAAEYLTLRVIQKKRPID
jgi:hypothetical protein